LAKSKQDLLLLDLSEEKKRKRVARKLTFLLLSLLPCKRSIDMIYIAGI
jgi:hypothetical protein